MHLNVIYSTDLHSKISFIKFTSLPCENRLHRVKACRKSNFPYTTSCFVSHGSTFHILLRRHRVVSSREKGVYLRLYKYISVRRRDGDSFFERGVCFISQGALNSVFKEC